jgi:carbon-monoxide dehydrogenase large subunit
MASTVTEQHHGGPFLHARWFGTPVKRREDPKLITGHGIFIDDITPPRTVYLAFVRSPYAHARIVSIDTTAAKAMPGVVDVLTAADIAGWVPEVPPNRGVRQPPRHVLAREKVRMVGDAVAVVLAESRYQAADAAEAVVVKYEELPAVTDPEAAMQPGAPVLWDDFPNNAIVVDDLVSKDEVDEVIAGADVVISRRMTAARLAPAAIETRGFVAQYQPHESYLTVWSTTQAPHRMRLIMSRMLGMPEARIRVICP